jgi:methionyl aminopeptidase
MPSGSNAVQVKSDDEIARMRQAGHIVAVALRALRERVAPGVTTAVLDGVAESVIRDLGGEPSFKGYHGYPATICASVNEEIVHGIPGARSLVEGDIVSLDVGAIWQGYQGDAAITLPVGIVGRRLMDLMSVTEASLEAGIRAAHAGAHLSDISAAIERAARQGGFEVIREYGGHGIGRAMHEAPHIRNWGPPKRGIALREGMTLALEPMLSLGGFATRVLADHWTVVTVDGSPTAHFEHTVVVRKDCAEILTAAATSAECAI